MWINRVLKYVYIIPIHFTSINPNNMLLNFKLDKAKRLTSRVFRKLAQISKKLRQYRKDLVKI